MTKTEVSVNIGDMRETSLSFIGDNLAKSKDAKFKKEDIKIFNKFKSTPKKIPIQINQKRIPVRKIDTSTCSIWFEKELGQVLTEDEIKGLGSKE